MSSNKTDASLAPAVTQALRILEFISSSDNLVGVSDICRNLDVNNNMAFRVLKTLEKEDWIYSDSATGKYQLTLKPMRITSTALTRIDLNTAAVPFVYSVWQATGESTYLAILQGDHVLYLQHLDSINQIRISGTIGGLYPAATSAPGKALLAFCSDEYIEEHLLCKDAPSIKNGMIKDPSAFKDTLKKIRENKYAIDNEEYGPGIFCYAAPIFDYTNQVVAAIGCSGAAALYGTIDKFIEKHGSTISNAAEQISALMGYLQ